MTTIEYLHLTWKNDVVVDLQPADDGRGTVACLAPHVRRVAISDHRIRHVDETSLTYQYLPKKSRVMKERTVTGDQFVRGFAQHILPTGFRKVRCFGWMANHSRTPREELRMIHSAKSKAYWLYGVISNVAIT